MSSRSMVPLIRASLVLRCSFIERGATIIHACAWALFIANTIAIVCFFDVRALQAARLLTFSFKESHFFLLYDSAPDSLVLPP